MTKKIKNLSIIIVSYNTKKLTVDCVKSIINSKTKVSFEVIVVDNGSSDGSQAALRKFQIPNSKFQIKLIENNENVGFSKANNQGIKIARGKYILLLNSDTIVKKGAIDKLVEFANKTPDAGAVVPKLLNKDGSVQPSCFNLPTITRAIKQYWLGKEKILDKYSPVTSHQSPVTVESAVMAAFLITPKALKEVGFLNEKYFMYFEDLDYCRNINKKGLKIYYLPDAEVIHLHGASGKNLKKENDQWRRLIPSSKIYNGTFKHYLLSFIIWSGQKWQTLFSQ